MEHKFVWDADNDPYLMGLKKKYELEKLKPEHADELAVVESIVKWVHGRWKHQNKRPKVNDPLSILEEARGGNGFRCVEYSIVLRACLAALGMRARLLSLRTKDVETKKAGAGHVIVEVYSPHYKKWVMADPQFGTIPSLNGIPLNAIQLKDAIKNQKTVKFYGLGPSESRDYTTFIEKYLFYFQFKFDQRIRNSGINGLVFGPVDAKKPTKFEGHDLSESENDVFVHSEKSFYLEPTK
jgi:hypothetical protein